MDEDFVQYLKEFFDEINQKIIKIITDNYFDWIDNWDFKTKGPIYDDDCQYRTDISQTDIENCLDISYLAIYIHNQDFKDDYEFSDTKCYFYNECMIIFLKDKFYLIETIWGQGSITSLQPINIEEYKNKVNYYFDLNLKQWKSFS